MTWPTNVQPFGQNHAPLLVGLSSTNNGDTVPIAVDPTNGAVLVDVEVTVAAPTPPATIVNGQISVGVAAAALPNNVLAQGVTIEALTTNTASIYVGKSTVTTSGATGGIEVPPGAAVTIPVANSATVYLISTAASQAASFVGS